MCIPSRVARSPQRGAARALLALLAVALFSAGVVAQPAAQPQPPEVAVEHLLEPALELELRHGRRRTKGSRIEQRLSPAVIAALNEWAPAATRLGLAVVVAEQAPALVLGTLEARQLVDVARSLDETFELLQPLQPAGEDPRHAPALVAFVFDEAGLNGAPLAGVVAALVEQRVLSARSAEQFLARPGGLSMRHANMFIQPGYDMAGDAAAGDDEFRLANAVAHQAAQCTLTRRFGQLPRAVLWGLGFVVEQRLFESVYHFDARGFIASGDHFDWPDKARDVLADEQLLGSAAWLDGAAAGRATSPQLLAWAQLDQLLHGDAASLASLLTELGALHRADDPFGNRSDYAGDPEAAQALLVEHVDRLPAKALKRHLKRLR